MFVDGICIGNHGNKSTYIVCKPLLILYVDVDQQKTHHLQSRTWTPRKTSKVSDPSDH